MKICFVIPTKNEEKTIESVLQSVQAEVQRLGHELVDIYVVDDSKDKTREIVMAAGGKVLNGGGRGLGFAMYKGLKSASKSGCEAIVTMDADGQVNISELKSFLTPLLEDRADFVIGSRFLEKGLVKYSYRFRNRFGVIVLSWILRRLTKLPITDSHGGIRALRPEVAAELEMLGTHSYVQETIIDAAEKGFKITEIPSEWKVRQHGSSKVVSSIFLYVFNILPILFVRAKYHIKMLFTLGICFILGAILDLSYVLVSTNFSLQTILDRQSLNLFFLILSLGVNMFLFGLVIEFLSLTLKAVNKTSDAS